MFSRPYKLTTIRVGYVEPNGQLYERLVMVKHYNQAGEEERIRSEFPHQVIYPLYEGRTFIPWMIDHYGVADKGIWTWIQSDQILFKHLEHATHCALTWR